jgi:hypothetical protein
MRFRADGPDIPDPLVSAQERGQVLFICGAGVSMHIGLPDFRGLVQAIYDALGEDWAPHAAEREVMAADGSLKGQYDRVLRSLERRLAASNVARAQGMRDRMQAAVRASLVPPPGVDLSHHAALLSLSRGAEGQTRLATTNFDTLFEQAWPGGGAPSHAGAALPQPLTAACTGVLHLHGRLRDDALGLGDTDIVLTSAEFGDAYLRAGWASRYVYDLVRAYTVVLVGYQADDPPMRYLLEVLEADRERFSDLQPVYAFAHAAPGQEALQTALWRSKGVEPILHRSVAGSYAPLYDTLGEWALYAGDPTVWRREAVRPLLAAPPSTADEAGVLRAVELLSHGDAGALLAELDPDPAWLETLRERGRLFSGATLPVVDAPPRIKPGAWIAGRIDDLAMITACAGLPAFDEDAVWLIRRAVDQADPPLSEVRRQAWDLLLETRAGGEAPDYGLDWFRTQPRIAAGHTGFPARRLIAGMARPRLSVGKPYRFDAGEEIKGPETLGRLMWVDFTSSLPGPVDEILQAWPNRPETNLALIETLIRTLTEALEQAEDVGFLSGWDGADRDVPSVAPHPQNEYRDGFYPIVQLIAALWTRLADGDPPAAAALAQTWAASRLSLVRRLALFAGAHRAVPAEIAMDGVDRMDDDAFWIGNSRVEMTRLLIARWAELPRDRRVAVEARIRQGMPRDLFREDVEWDDGEWAATLENAVYRRLSRLQGAGCALEPESEALLAGIAAAYPEWRPGPGDRDDFGSWSETRMGPDGHPELLESVADERLVEEALRLQQENAYEEHDLWRVFVGSDPSRALRGLRARAEAGTWEAEAWRPLLWAAFDHEDAALQADLAAALLEVPPETLVALADSAASWLRRQRAALAEATLWALWDRLADVVYRPGEPAEPDGDLETRSLNDAGGVLAWILLDALSATSPAAGSEFAGAPEGLQARLDRAVAAPEPGGLLARVRLVRHLAWLHRTAPDWTGRTLVPLMAWTQPEAATLWKAQASDQIGGPELYNALRPDLLSALFSEAIPDRDAGHLVGRLLQIVISHINGFNPEYEGEAAELRSVLARGRPALRQTVASQLWRLTGRRGAEAESAAERWRTTVGPVFDAIWPLDAALRSAETSKLLVNMALAAGDAFPEAVEAIKDVVAPYRLFRIAHSLLIGEGHRTLHQDHPIAFIALLDALIDPEIAAAPDDLGTVLDDCVEADGTVVGLPAYRRLRAIQRLSQA